MPLFVDTRSGDFGQLGEIFCLRNTTHCVVLRKQNIPMPDVFVTYNYLDEYDEYLDELRSKVYPSFFTLSTSKSSSDNSE